MLLSMPLPLPVPCHEHALFPLMSTPEELGCLWVRSSALRAWQLLLSFAFSSSWYPLLLCLCAPVAGRGSWCMCPVLLWGGAAAVASSEGKQESFISQGTLL